jgi:hypothetical protein
VKLAISVEDHHGTRLDSGDVLYVKILGYVLGYQSNIACDLHIPYKTPGEAVGAEPDNAGAVGAMALHAVPALAKAEDAKAFAIVSAIDASVGVTVGLPSNTRPACTPHASAAGAEPHNAAVGSAMALHAVPALAKAEDAKASAIVSAIDASVSVTVGLPDNAVVARVCSKETTHERPPSIVAAIALRPVGLLPVLHHIDTLTLGTLHVHKRHRPSPSSLRNCGVCGRMTSEHQLN